MENHAEKQPLLVAGLEDGERLKKYLESKGYKNEKEFMESDAYKNSSKGV